MDQSDMTCLKHLGESFESIPCCTVWNKLESLGFWTGKVIVFCWLIHELIKRFYQKDIEWSQERGRHWQISPII